MANPLQRFTLAQLNTLLQRYQNQMIESGPASTVSWSDGGHSESVRTLTVMEVLEILNRELDRRDPAQANMDLAYARFN